MRGQGDGFLDACVFHMRTPENASARELLPLSALRESNPETYRRALAKYDDTPQRRRLPGTRVPGTGGTWIDVVFCSPVRPRVIWEAWREAGGDPLPSQEFWAIPIADVPGALLFDRTLSSTGEPIDPREVRALDPRTYSSWSATTPGNRAWLEDLLHRGRRGAWFHRTPHVLVPGPVPLRNARIIDWADD